MSPVFQLLKEQKQNQKEFSGSSSSQGQDKPGTNSSIQKRSPIRFSFYNMESSEIKSLGSLKITKPVETPQLEKAK